MRHSIDKLISILDIKPQINLQFMNTFFALTIASYYVVVHHTPKGLRWPSHLSFDKIKKDIIEEKPQLEELSPLLLLHNLTYFSTYTPSELYINQKEFYATSPLPFIINLAFKNFPLLYKNEIISINLTKNHIIKNEIYEKQDGRCFLSQNHFLSFQQSNTPIRTSSTHRIQNWTPSYLTSMENIQPITISSQIGIEDRISTKIEKKTGLDMGIVRIEPSRSTHLSRGIVEQSQSLPAINPPLSPLLLHPALQTSTPYEETVLTTAPLNSAISISENKISTEFPEKITNSLNRVGEEMTNTLPGTQTPSPPIPLTDIIEKLENISKEDKKIVPSPILSKPEEKPKNADDMLSSWSTYKPQSKSILLTYWLQRLAPASKEEPRKANVKLKEIPFRRALIETLLSEEFQPHIGPTWEPPIGAGWEPSEEEEEDGNDSEDIKALRRSFHDTYMKKINWAATRFQRLFLIDGSEDLHQVNEEAYLKAYYYPLRLGIRVYRDEDFPCFSE